MAKLIRIDGTREDVFPADAENGFTLQELYVLIGCEIVEAIHLCRGIIMLIDENGKLRRDCLQRRNDAATEIFRLWRDPHDWITGNVLICDDKEFQ